MGIIRLVKFSFTVLILVHLIACFWFYTAKFDDFHPDSWVARHGYLDLSNSDRYIASLY